VEAIDLRCIDFIGFKDYGSIVFEECRIMVCKCLLEMLKINGFI
jgi:hypothetical protein